MSVGTIHICSSSRQVDPRIDQAYQRHQVDIEILSKGLAFLEKLVSANPFAQKRTRRYMLGTSVDLKDAHNRKDWIKRMVAT